VYAAEVGMGWGLRALQFLLHHLATHRVLGLGDVAHDVEVAQPLKLCGQLAAALSILAGVSAGLGLDRVDHELAEHMVVLEVV
jgi:hypothetical protein